MLPMLAHIAVSTRIRVQNLVHGVATSLPRSFAIIERSQVKRVVTKQRIAQHKHLINPPIATSGEAGPIRRLAPIVALNHRHGRRAGRSEEHTSELQSRQYLVCRLLLEKK